MKKPRQQFKAHLTGPRGDCVRLMGSLPETLGMVELDNPNLVFHGTTATVTFFKLENRTKGAGFYTATAVCPVDVMGAGAVCTLYEE